MNLYLSRLKAVPIFMNRYISLHQTMRFLTLIAFLFTFLSAQAQYFTSQSYWKQERHEVAFGVGAINFLGELGGRDAIGRDFIIDLELSMFRPALHLEYRYKTSRKTLVKAGFHYGVIAGNDALTNEPFRNNRNIHFKSNIFELSAKFEMTLYEIQPGARYKLIGVKQRPKGGVFYGFAGIGITYFDPKANFNGEWLRLKPFGTEGQNFPDGPKPYSNFTPVVPMGLGYRTYLSSSLSLGIEISHRITFTDYMDDTSTRYYNKNAIENQSGYVAAYFSDPSLGFRTNAEGQTEPFNTTGTGAQRGDPQDNDSYLFAMITLTHKFTKQRASHRGKIRVTRKRGGKVIF
jgi:hypothetical protein